MKRPALKNKQVVLLRIAFRARKVLGTFEKRAPAHLFKARQNELMKGKIDRFHCHAIKKINQKLSSAKSYEIVML